MQAMGRRVFGALAVGVVLAVGACCASAAGASNTTLRVGIAEANWTALDPQVGTFWADAWSLLHASCTTLVTNPAVAGPLGQTLVPDGAAGFPRVSPDGRTYTFTIRQNLRFSDGTYVTAANYARAIGRLVDPALNSEMASYAHGIEAVHGKGQRLTIALKEPAGDLLERLALPMFCPVPVAFPVDPAGITLSVGSGPYRVASVVPERSATLVRNPYYRGLRHAHFDRIIFTMGGTPESLESDVASGRLDYSFDGVPPDLVPAAASTYKPGKGALFFKPSAGIAYLPLNLKSPLFENNLPLRRAVEFAIDRAEVVRQLAPFVGRRLGQLVPPGVSGRGPDAYPLAGANLQFARRLAKGHLRGGMLTFYTFASANFVRVANIIAYNLEQIGLHVNVRAFSPLVEQAKLHEPTEHWDLGTSFWLADFADASDFVLPIVGLGGPAPIHDHSFVAGERRASRLTGPAREAAFAELARTALTKYAAVVPLYSFTAPALVSPRLSCVSFNVMTEINLSDLCLRG
jgi:peptide/nickel transport system substrate-binding protein